MINGDLTKERIAAMLNEKPEVLLFDSIDSTNNEAKRLAKSAKGELLLVAREQTAGRGRMGRSYYSPSDTGIYMSLLLFYEDAASELLSVTTAAAVAVSKAIEKLSGKKTQIKWVNDILIDLKKVCGILCESVSAGGKTAVIIGIGINISTAEFPKEVENGGCIGEDIDKAQLVAKITNNLYDNLFNGVEYMDYYRSRSALIGKRIAFYQGKIKTPAYVIGIDNGGGLEVLLENGERKILRSGEITVRSE